MSTVPAVRDRLGRPLHDLRISVTDRCNFRCPYCMPAEIYGEKYRFLPRPELLQFEEIERPTAGEGEILVRVKAASVNRADLDGIEPRPAFVRLFIGLRAPRMRSIGIDVAGIVEAVGTGVTRFRPGDAVFADLFGQRYGSFAEYAAAPEREFEPMPADMSFEEAATLPHSAILALQGLRLRRGRTIKPGDTLTRSDVVRTSAASGAVLRLANGTAEIELRAGVEIQLAAWGGDEDGVVLATGSVPFVPL